MANKIIEIKEIPSSEYVYDLETPDGNYVCGSNKVIVKQSNSCFNKYAAKADVKYGDSVMPNTSIMINDRNVVSFVMIKDLANSKWMPYKNFKPGDSGRSHKQKAITKVKVWDGEKWSKIRKVIRHKVNKKIYRVSTCTGIVEVTEDHSLIDSNHGYIKPGDVCQGTDLFSGYPTFPIGMSKMNIKSISKYTPVHPSDKNKFIYGVFYVCGKVDSDGLSWGIYHSNKNILLLCKKILEDLHLTEFVIDIICSNKQYKLCPKEKGTVSSYVANCYDGDCKIVPTFVLNGINKHAFLAGCLTVTSLDRLYNPTSQLGNSGIFYLMRSLYIQISIINNCFVNENASIPGEVLSVELVDDGGPDYVYDLETKSGRFQAGVGTMIVKNTDSIYTQFLFPDDHDLSKEERLIRSWELASECADRISDTFKKPIELEMEKIMWPLYLYGKKRYACKIFEYNEKTNVFNEHLDLKGIQAVRRDNCKLVKTISNPVFDMLLNKNNVQGAIDVIQEFITKMFEGELGIDEYIITKTLNSNYKLVNKVGNKMSLPGHARLAELMKQRKVMNIPQLGDRVPFVYIEVQDKKAKGGDRMEDPNYVLDPNNKCKIDFMFYMEKQLSSPIYTIFEVLVKDENGEMYPRKEMKDGSTKISKDCKYAINELLWNKIILRYCQNPGTYFIKKKIPNQTKITDTFNIKK